MAGRIETPHRSHSSPDTSFPPPFSIKPPPSRLVHPCVQRFTPNLLNIIAAPDRPACKGSLNRVWVPLSVRENERGQLLRSWGIIPDLCIQGDLYRAQLNIEVVRVVGLWWFSAESSCWDPFLLWLQRSAWVGVPSLAWTSFPSKISMVLLRSILRWVWYNWILKSFHIGDWGILKLCVIGPMQYNQISGA